MEKKASLLNEETCQERLNCDARFEDNRKTLKGKVVFRCKLPNVSNYRRTKLEHGDLLPGCEHYIDDQMSFLSRKHW